MHVGSKGNWGKPIFNTNTLLNIHIPPAFYEEEKSGDITRGLSSLGYEPRVIFGDLVRQVFDEENGKDYVNYKLFESLKNGAFMSTNYNPEMVYWRRKPHFVIFTNQHLDHNKLSPIDGSCENFSIMVQLNKNILQALPTTLFNEKQTS